RKGNGCILIAFVELLMGIGLFVMFIGYVISWMFSIQTWQGYICGTACYLFIVILLFLPSITDRIGKWIAARKQLEHETWLQTPQGKAWLVEEQERLRKQMEEAERLRKEAEEPTARTMWKLYHESTTMVEISRMLGPMFEEFLSRLFSNMGYTD